MNTTTALNTNVPAGVSGKAQTASPEPGTIKQVAWCARCEEMIQKTPISKGWFHAETGKREC